MKGYFFIFVYIYNLCLQVAQCLTFDSVFGQMNILPLGIW